MALTTAVTGGAPLEIPVGGSSIAWKCSAASPSSYLNLDKVIKIIRREDESKCVLTRTFKLSDVQVRGHPHYAAAQSV